MTKRNLSVVSALKNEDPAKVSRVVRLLWKDIQAAIERGHTLKVIHERLAEGGVSVSYRQFCIYVARLRAQTLANGAASTSTTQSSTAPPGTVQTHDPLANVRERLIRNRPGFNYDDGLPDTEKLIG